MSNEKKVYYYENGKWIYGTKKKRPDLLDKILGTKPKEIKEDENESKI